MDKQSIMSSLRGFTWPTRSGTLHVVSTTSQIRDLMSSSTGSVVESSGSGSTVVYSPTSTVGMGGEIKPSSGGSLQIMTVTRPGSYYSASREVETATSFVATSVAGFTSSMVASASRFTTHSGNGVSDSKSRATVTVTVTDTELSGPETVFMTVSTSSSMHSQTSSAVSSSESSASPSLAMPIISRPTLRPLPVYSSSFPNTYTTHTLETSSYPPPRTGYPSEFRPLPTVTSSVIHTAEPLPTSVSPSTLIAIISASLFTEPLTLYTPTTFTTTNTGIPPPPSSWPAPIPAGSAKVPFPTHDTGIIAGSVLGAIAVLCAVIWICMCWRKEKLGFGCLRGKGKSKDEEKGPDDGVEGGDDENNAGREGKSGLFSCIPFILSKKGGIKKDDAEKALDAPEPAYGVAAADTAPADQAQGPTDTIRWSHVDSIMSWAVKDRVLMYWAKAKGVFSSIFHKSEKNDESRNRDIENDQYSPEDCIAGPDYSSSHDEEYMMSGAREVASSLGEDGLVDVPLSDSSLPVEPEAVLAKGYGLNLMHKYWKEKGKCSRADVGEV